jgi:hypothetical protein
MNLARYVSGRPSEVDKRHQRYDAVARIIYGEKALKDKDKNRSRIEELVWLFRRRLKQ